MILTLLQTDIVWDDAEANIAVAAIKVARGRTVGVRNMKDFHV